MKNKDVKNIAASVKERLRNISKETAKDFNKILRQYIQERFLFRLSQSAYSNNFILKGALLFLAYDISRMRPTKDIDFLGSAISNKHKDIIDAVSEIARIDCEDGIEFDDKNIDAEDIVEDGDYEGIRLKVNGKLGTVNERIQIDVGFGDKIVAGPVAIEFPTLLDLPAPKLNVYSLETAIAEKFEAIVSLQLITSRMKDFYDIYFLSKNNKFELSTLNKAIAATFEHRGTDMKSSAFAFDNNFKNDEHKQKLWLAFIQRNELDVTESFAEIVENIKLFIEPALMELKKNKTWLPEKYMWVENE